MANPEVAERRRFCSQCGSPVGRGTDGQPGRTEGVCERCGTPFSFTPKLSPGELVGGQYEVLGCLAYGGLGWIYLARDRNVNDRWVVLKGLLDSGDTAAMEAAVSERRFLAEVEHPNIVKIYNFVQHPDPRDGTMVGYIVMEYVGGQTLKELRSRPGPDGRPQPLPVAQAIAYALEVLPAMGYLHGLGLLYCDFKPDNVIQSEEQVKLIDLGAVHRINDWESATYKTDGYCAPEVVTTGPSVTSDLYTIARSLAVLTFDFDYSKAYKTQLPNPTQVPLLARHDSYYRLLLRATDPQPAKRFRSAQEMVDQLTGVLREVLAVEDGQPRPGVSTLFSPERHAFGTDTDTWPAAPAPAEVVAGMAVPQVDPADPAAGFLATAASTDPADLIGMLSAIPTRTVEVRLRLARTRIELNDLQGAINDLNELARTEPPDWRVHWYWGLVALARNQPRHARTSFDTVYSLLPGEAAPKLALAVTEEHLGNRPAATRYYDLVWRTDRSAVSAAFGLARVRLSQGDRAGAVAVLESVPDSSSQYLPAQLAAIRALTRDRDPAELTEDDLVKAADRLESLTLEAERRTRLAIEVLNAARAWVLAGRPGASRSGPRKDVLGCALTDRDLCGGLERAYRTLARLAEDPDRRTALVDRANAVRPLTWV
ncbi:serine/threonine-protein kinase PknG [Goodfellowiella coeruleoviolacea]|uniref:non-specific serine/threonine protein kinase n=2 Tax=Goodfellowiella coeruleoviolacea TaxID=334858 RepID=A0AAE3GD70_9PSEU|nr:serine/threonine-protein kinase PknG [Goodfellowiella coeruleoviolacea]